MPAPFPLQVVVHDGRRYLLNASPCPVRRLLFSVGYSYIDWDGGTLIDSSVPRYELHDVPAQSHVLLDVTDSDRAGIVWWQADEVEWADGRTDTHVELPERHLWGGALPGVRAERPQACLSGAAAV